MIGPKRMRARRGRKPRRLTLKKVNAKVNKIIRGNEKKISLVAITGVTDDAGLVDWISGIDKGTGSEDRIGQIIIGKKMQLRYRLNMTAAGTHDFEYVRIMVLKQKVTFNAKPLPSVLLEALTVESFKDLSFGQRYVILYDRTHVLNRSAGIVGAWNDGASPLFTKSINLRDMKIGFNDTTVVVSTGAGSSTNQLFLFGLTTAATNPATLDLQAQLTYTDA